MAYRSSINTGLPNIADPPEPEFFAEFTRIYNAIRNLTVAIDNYTGSQSADPSLYSQTPATSTVLVGNLQRYYVKFSEAATYGQVVNLWNNAGTVNARLAKASAGYQMHGWSSLPATIAAGAYGEVILGGLCTAISGLTPGTTYYLGNTAGTVASSPGAVSQKVGYAIGTSNLVVRPDLI